ncbi:alcohol dehydrogenase catalytic domain-containing protein [Methylobacter svalbardensis]|uniref:alcohol dehydrogenase catalytic domain-containing protein n=1 Tax=Methylobacter svalbardensis TaxID=3080016 RepID=UPI0030EE1D98
MALVHEVYHEKIIDYAAYNHNSPLLPLSFGRRDPTPTYVRIEILFCGVCHSDIRQVRNEWGSSVFPIVLGHEIVGKVTQVGSAIFLC